MKRTDIKAGVVYAVHSSYGSPKPVVFLQDGAAGLFQHQRGGGAPRDVTGSRGVKAGKGSFYAPGGTGYAAVVPSRFGDFAEMPYKERVQALYSLDIAAELARFKDGKEPLGSGMQFEIITSLTKVRGEYEAESAAYEKKAKDDRAASDARDLAVRQLHDRARAAAAQLTTQASLWSDEEGFDHLGVSATSIRAGQRPSLITMPVGDAELLARLLGRLRDAHDNG